MFLILIHIFSNSHPTPTPNTCLKYFTWSKALIRKVSIIKFQVLHSFFKTFWASMLLWNYSYKKRCGSVDELYFLLFILGTFGHVCKNQCVYYRFIINIDQSHSFIYDKNRWNLIYFDKNLCFSMFFDVFLSNSIEIYRFHTLGFLHHQW